MFSSIQLNFTYSIIPSYLSLYSNISITFVPNSNAVGFSENIYSTASLFSSLKATNASPCFFNNNILYIPSDLEPYPFLTVSEFVTLIINHTGGIKTAEQLISELNLKRKEDTRIEELSQGMRKKLSLINLFIRDIGLLILDEPFNSIDVTYITQLKSILKTFKGKTTILISSHILDTLNDLCDSFILLKNGEVAKTFANTGSIRELEEQLYD